MFLIQAHNGATQFLSSTARYIIISSGLWDGSFGPVMEPFEEVLRHFDVQRFWDRERAVDLRIPQAGNGLGGNVDEVRFGLGHLFQGGADNICCCANAREPFAPSPVSGLVCLGGFGRFCGLYLRTVMPWQLQVLGYLWVQNNSLGGVPGSTWRSVKIANANRITALPPGGGRKLRFENSSCP